MSYTSHAIYARESTRISEVTRVKTRALRERCMQCFQELSRVYTFSTRCVHCGHSNDHPCQTHKLCSNLVELLHSAPPFSKVRRPLDDTSDRKFTRNSGNPLRDSPEMLFSRSHFINYRTCEKLHRMCRISHSTAGEMRWVAGCFSKGILIDRSLRDALFRPLYRDRCNVDQSERWRIHLSCACHEALLFDRTCEILYFPRKLRSIFSSSWRISRVLRSFVETSCAHVVSFSNHTGGNIFVFGIYQFIFYIFRLFIYLLVFFFPIFLAHSMYAFHSIFPCG